MTARSHSINPMTDPGLGPRSWVGMALRGVAAVLLGGISILLPDVAFMSLVLVFGAYAMADGVIALVDAARSNAPGRGWAIFRGLTSLAAGVLTLLWPGISAFALVMTMAAWSVVGGAFEIATAVALRKQLTGEWLLGLQGVLSMLFGLVMAIAPLLGALMIGYWIGSYALLAGGVMIAAAFRLRKLARSRSGRIFVAA